MRTLTPKDAISGARLSFNFWVPYFHLLRQYATRLDRLGEDRCQRVAVRNAGIVNLRRERHAALRVDGDLDRRAGVAFALFPMEMPL